MKLDLFDARLTLGDPFMKKGAEAATAADALEKTGIAKAVIIMEEQFYYDHKNGLELINSILEKHGRFRGLIPMVPGCTGEIGHPDKFVAERFSETTAGLLLCPDAFRIPKRPVFLADWFETAVRRRIPVWYRAENDSGFEYIADILASYPQLIVVLSFADRWPNNRKVYPLLNIYAGVHVCLSDLIWMGAVEDVVAKFGSGRLLFCTDYPKKYMEAAVTMLSQADICLEDKHNIAGRNLENLSGGMLID